jgi:hypothetical protein
MPRAGDLLDIHWRRWSRWCLLGTIVMLVWLVGPAVTCRIRSLQDTPLAAVEQAATSEAKPGFFERWWTGTKRCYAATPLLGQEQWKTMLLLSLAGATVATNVIARFANRKHGLS